MPTAITPRDAAADPSRTSPPSRNRQYLLLYNLTSLILWSLVLVRVALILLLSATRSNVILDDPDSPPNTLSTTWPASNVYPSAHSFVAGVQTLAVAEVLHSVLGVVRAPVATTGMQVASRLLLVWGVVWMFGDDGLLVDDGGLAGMVKGVVGVRTQADGEREYTALAYVGMLVAWGVTECVRYGYFVFSLSAGGEGKEKEGMKGVVGTAGVPAWLSWLRYNTFFVLYPLGISCECWLIYKAIPYAKMWKPEYAYGLMAILGIYVPGSYILYSHMMAQRRKVMRGKGKEKAK